VPKTAQPWVATLVRTVFDQPDADAVGQQFTRVLDPFAERLPAARGRRLTCTQCVFERG
jgi:transposase-like protein